MKRICPLLLCMSLCASLFAGCTVEEKPYVPTGDGLTYEEDYTGPAPSRPDEKKQELTLTYYPDESMNPYLCNDYTNRALFSLLYQSLFVVDRDYNAQPQLCSQFSVSEDMKHYTFYIEQATFSDGSTLSPADVLQSLQAAEESDYYGGRFTYITDMSLSEDGGVTIDLSVPNENLPLLLDIPIVKGDQVGQNAPAGTGPYLFQQSDEGSVLSRRTDWWCNPQMVITADTISLIDAQSNAQIRDAFQFSDLNLVCADPGSDRYSDYRSDYELWDCENGIFLYLTPNASSKVFSVPEVRRALTHAINREKLTEGFYRGFARAANLPASPLFPYYNQTLASQYAYAPEKFTQAVESAGLKDTSVEILVNSGDSRRVRVARTIAEMLNQCGLKATTKELSGKDYTYTLSIRGYDLHLGQTKLSPNMDLTEFFSENGVLSWGGIGSETTYNLCLQALENHGNYYTLHQTVMDSGMLCPILFRSYAVFATRGLVTGLTPSRDNVFYYSLGKTMDEAKIME